MSRTAWRRSRRTFNHRQVPRLLPADLSASIDDLSDRQGGFVLMRQLVALDMPRSTISRLTRTGGPLQRVLPATYFTGRRELTLGDRETAVLLYAGSPSLLTGSAALQHYGSRYLPEDPRVAPIHVLIGHDRKRASRSFARIERTFRLPPPVPLHHRPLAPFSRALFDAARHVPDQRLTRAVILEALQGERITVDQLEQELEAGQRRWTALIRDVVREFRSGSASAPEAEFRQAWEARGLPPMVWNPRLYSPEGDFIARTDGYCPVTGMALEIESREYHAGRRWAATLGRQRRMTSYGIVVVPVVPEQFRRDEERVVQEVLRARQSLLGRPLPLVTVVPFLAA